MDKASKICTCNHGSKREVHANPEDNLFQNKSEKSSFSKKQKDSHHHHKDQKKKSHSHSSEKSSKQLANCHSAKPGEAHACSCSKKKDSLSELRIYHQVWISLPVVSFQPPEPMKYSSLFFSSTSIIADGFANGLLRPPKV